MRRADAISILALILSAGALVITATGGAGGVKPTGDKAPSTPIVIDADGKAAGALSDALDSGDVGVLMFEAEAK